MHILIATNAFKNSLTASEAGEAIKMGLQQSKLVYTCECFPVADGGDGTGKLIIKSFHGRHITRQVSDPLGRKINASFGLIHNDETAVVEMADSSGLKLLQAKELHPLWSSSSGTGELIKFALDEGAKKILLAMGGSATVDGGTGILRALGARFVNKQNEELHNLPEELIQLETIDLSAIDKRAFDCSITVLCDVDNQLLGSKGAAAVFGPQKGADASAVIQLEAALQRLRDVALEATGKDMSTVKYGGTAGGASAGVYAFLNADLVSGADYFLQLIGFEKSLENANLVITGEGSIDEQTLQGKAPFAVATMAKKKNLPVIGLAGKVPLRSTTALNKYFDIIMAIGNEPSDMNTAVKRCANNLIRTAKEIGNLLSISFSGKS